MKREKPNVVLISMDTVRADHLSCYGYHKNTTPNLDSLAKDGLLFKNCSSAAVWTPPGHGSMLTGLYPSEHGVQSDNVLDQDIPTIATILKSNNYKTAGYVCNSQVGELVGFNKGHDVFGEIWKGDSHSSFIKRVVCGLKNRVKSKFVQNDDGANEVNKSAIKWMRQNKDHPFYLFLHYIEPHNPLNPPKRYKKKFVDSDNAISVSEKLKKIIHNPLVCYVESLSVDEKEIQYLKSLYDAEIAYTDFIVGNILKELKALDVYDNTIIIVTADHGEHFGEHGKWSHVASLHKEILNVPLIIKLPKSQNIKGIYDELVQTVDVLPTVSALIEEENKNEYEFSGLNIIDIINNPAKKREYVIAEWEGRIPYYIQAREDQIKNKNVLKQITQKLISVQDNGHKLIHNGNGEHQFYNIKDDPEEKENLYGKVKVPEHFGGVIDSYIKLQKKDENGKQVEMDDEVRKNLEALGYI